MDPSAIYITVKERRGDGEILKSIIKATNSNIYTWTYVRLYIDK